MGNASRQEAEYYVAAYAKHYGVPVEFVRALVEQESGWHRCAISRKGAAGLMQLMPDTAKKLNVQDRCDAKQNVSGGGRHLARLMAKFHGDLRLVAAAYYAGERVIEVRGLQYANPDVVAYVASIRQRVERHKQVRSANVQRTPGRTR
ncbi:MAG: lytic transglycosylase domain-containing protein [Acidobacteriia bacterium]|nr:lytic transglycosylase domain-containing protein [Terriglobia bacterium]